MTGSSRCRSFSFCAPLIFLGTEAALRFIDSAHPECADCQHDKISKPDTERRPAPILSSIKSVNKKRIVQKQNRKKAHTETCPVIGTAKPDRQRHTDPHKEEARKSARPTPRRFNSQADSTARVLHTTRATCPALPNHQANRTTAQKPQ